MIKTGAEAEYSLGLTLKSLDVTTHYGIGSYRTTKCLKQFAGVRHIWPFSVLSRGRKDGPFIQSEALNCYSTEVEGGSGVGHGGHPPLHSAPLDCHALVNEFIYIFFDTDQLSDSYETSE